MGKILIVDDEKNIRKMLNLILVAEGHDCEMAENGNQALNLVDTDNLDLVLLDLQLPDLNGLEVLKKIKTTLPALPVIIISGHGTIQDAVQAVKLGAYSFLEKPIDRDMLMVHVRNSLEQVRLEKENSNLREKLKEDFEIVGKSSTVVTLMENIRKVAPTRGRVLITGESGSGKELVARAIHEFSDRAGKPFIKVNCAAIPHDLIESELFGYEKGAFTGAMQRRIGKFEQAHTGTLFLDEIGDMSLHAQAKVLRALQTGEIMRVGGDRAKIVDVRFVAATNKDLKKEIAAQRFREDLYFRINVIPLQIEPLRARRDDIPLLAAYFNKKCCIEYGIQIKKIDDELIESLMHYHWPGNVRELRNIIERMIIMGRDPLTVKDLPPEIRGDSSSFTPKDYIGLSLRDAREKLERELIERKLEETDWNISQAADELGVERTNLHKKLNVYKLKRRG